MIAKQRKSNHWNFKELNELVLAGDPKAILQLVMGYEEDLFMREGKESCRRNLPKAVRLYRQAAQLGNKDAMLNLANCLELGRGTKKDKQEAFLWQKRAARLGHPSAPFNIAVTYRDQGSYTQAVKWFKKALLLGDTSAELELAKSELFARGTGRNIPLGLQRLQRLVQSQSASIGEKEEAALLLARTFLDGWLVPRSMEAALSWLKKAAKTNNGEAIAI